MSILFMKDGRSKPWRMKLNGKTSYYATEAEAKIEEEAAKVVKLKIAVNNIQSKETIGDLLEKFKDAHPNPSRQDKARLNVLLAHDIAKTPLNRYDEYEAEAYVADRQEEETKGSTIKRDLNFLRGVFKWARKQSPIYKDLRHPHIEKIKGSDKRRTRRLKDGELDKIIAACREYHQEGCHGLVKWHGQYVETAIRLAVDTGMRLREVLGLRRKDIDLGKRRLHIVESKTDDETKWDGRTIVLSLLAMALLEEFFERLGEPAPNDLLFPMPKSTFISMRIEVYQLAGVENLTFHDLRHEFASSVSEEEPELIEAEVSIMLGHKSKTQTEEYIQLNMARYLKKIQDKLDRQQLGGMTLPEVLEKIVAPGKEFRTVMPRRHQFDSDLMFNMILKNLDRLIEAVNAEMPSGKVLRLTQGGRRINYRRGN